MRKIFFITIILFALLLLGCAKLTYKSALDALKESDISYSEIIIEENYGEKGKVIFYRVSNPQNIGMSYLEETSSGWSWIDGMEHLLFEDLQIVDPTAKLTWFWSYQLKTSKYYSEENFIPLFMGLVIDPNIEKVIVKSILGTPLSVEKEIYLEAEIIQYGGTRIWYVLNQRDELKMLSQGPFNILGFSKEGELIYGSFKSSWATSDNIGFP